MSYLKSKVQNVYSEWANCTIDESSHVSPHFQFYEIMNPSCEEEVKLEFPLEARRAIRGLEFVRDKYGKAMPLSCGYRSPTWNKKKGGTDNSLHLKCCAFDAQVGKISDSLWNNFYLWVYAAATMLHTQAELGRYSWGLHIGFGELEYTKNVVYTFDKR